MSRDLGAGRLAGDAFPGEKVSCRDYLGVTCLFKVATQNPHTPLGLEPNYGQVALHAPS